MGHVAIAEDDPQVRALVTAFAKRLDWSVTECGDGVELLRAIAEEPIDYFGVLLDINMPRMDGIEVVLRLGEQCSDIPVVLMTGGATVNALAARHMAEAEGLWVATLLQKPFSFSEFQEAVACFERQPRTPSGAPGPTHTRLRVAARG